MRALIFEGVVAQVAVDEFPVHSSLVWVEAAAEVEPGYSYDGANFTAPVVQPEPEMPAVSDSEMLEALYEKAKGNDTQFNNVKAKRGDA